MKYIFITGGVSSSLGKGILSASLGALLSSRDYKVRLKKMDPYLNVDPGTISPSQHGEVFVTDDGAETDMDLGHYERFTGNLSNRNDSISAGKIYSNIIEKERRGDYLGDTIQVIPHVTNEIKLFIQNDMSDEEFLICEIGGTVGDIEGTPFLEAVRQFINEKGKNNVLVIHLTLLPYLDSASELKTKPTQHSVRELQGMGINPDIIVCRSSHDVSESEKRKIALFCNVNKDDIISAYDQKNIYNIPIAYHNEGLDNRVLNFFKIKNTKIDLSRWNDIEYKIANYKHELNIALIGKYTILPDAYKSLVEAMYHAGINSFIKINVHYIDAVELENSKTDLQNVLKNIDGILVGPGFGIRGAEGKINAIKYARENNIPFLGICFGMQMAIIEYARNVVGIADATSGEFTDKGSRIIDLLSNWVKDGSLETRNKSSYKGSTMRLGAYPTVLKDSSLMHSIYNKVNISERHRHRYEVNINYKNQLEGKGLSFSGMSPDNLLTEAVELNGHRWFVGVQYHPELKSQIFNPHPLFQKYIQACYDYNKSIKN